MEQQDKYIADRCRKVITWIVASGIARNQADVARMMGYDRAYISSAINNNGKITTNMINSICNISKKINRDWILTGNGDMITEEFNEISAYIMGKNINDIKKIITELNTRMAYIETTLKLIQYELEINKHEI